MNRLNPQAGLLVAPIGELVLLLCKQFHRLLLERGIQLTVNDMHALAEAARPAVTIGTPELHAALWAIVQESVAELDRRFGLTFAQSLAHDMGTLGGWETTAEFLERANHKSNAELRIAAGCSLLACLGVAWGVPYLRDVLAADGGVDDVEALIARRALCHLYDIDPQDRAWAERLRASWDDNKGN